MPWEICGRDPPSRLKPRPRRPRLSRSCFKEPPLKISGDADRYDHRAANDDYTQAGNLYRLMSADQRKQLIGNIVAAMQGVPKAIQERQVAHFTRCDAQYGRGVADGLGLAR